MGGNKMGFINVLTKHQRESILDKISDKVDGQSIDGQKVDQQKIDEAKQSLSEKELYHELLTMNMFANYYPHVFPDQYMFR
jgi:hypothetical protein